MDFILPFEIPTYPFKINYKDPILFTGSCFSEEISSKMECLKFNVLSNPNGILFNPESIFNSLQSYLNNQKFTAEDLQQNGEVYFSWQHHSIFSGIDKVEVLRKINSAHLSACQFIKKAKVLVITLGTAYKYQLLETQETVSNCHKIPNHHFQKRLIDINEIIGQFNLFYEKLKKVNPEIQIIFTVSPVKHIRDGVVENNRSKARLIEAVHSMVSKDIYYFPSYEIVTDILRDYRFFKEDLVHPNEIAVQYVFERFYHSFLDTESKQFINDMASMNRSILHRPHNPLSLSYQKFKADQLRKIENFEATYPSVNFAKEKLWMQP